MRATGIVRRIDSQNRIVIPKEIRRVMRLKEGDWLGMYLEDNGVHMSLASSCVSTYQERIDDLGRIRLSSEIIRALKIQPEDPVEIFTKEDTLVFKRYETESIVEAEFKIVIRVEGEGRRIVFDVYNSTGHLSWQGLSSRELQDIVDMWGKE